MYSLMNTDLSAFFVDTVTTPMSNKTENHFKTRLVFPGTKAGKAAADLSLRVI